ncbi:hypothetical protein C2845_PM16G15980 [Panicum miliaceum]|uniref:Protein argonaute N-terminal domain-containing protein n=1 Tax=Panicum miliaceum TaxID=4540 RepID=A0A3L6PWM4_PANMI|nr:hypothetical protein C2845_PM16G15980 [Panicum miliaceum]
MRSSAPGNSHHGHYPSVSINPEPKSRTTNKRVLNELIRLHAKTALGSKLSAYDGSKCLHTAGTTPFSSQEFVVTLVDPEKDNKRCYNLAPLIHSGGLLNVLSCRHINQFSEYWSHDQCWPSVIPEVIVCRPIVMMHYRQLDEILGEFMKLFEHVMLPPTPRKPNMKDNFVSFLNGFSRYIIHALLVCVCREGQEVRNICWGGSFELKDIWMSQGHLKINPNLEFHQYNLDDACRDYEKLHTLIQSTFHDPAIQGHPWCIYCSRKNLPCLCLATF